MDIGFDYKVTQPGVVLDVGAYNGDFIDFIRPKYQCGIHAFEPSKEKFANLIKKYSYDPMIWPYNVALEDESKVAVLYGSNDSKSIYRTFDEGREEIRVYDIWQFIQSFKLPKIDILKLNCEGSEYKIIARLCSLDFIKIVGNLVVQWHYLGTNNIEARRELESKLKDTHKLNFNCPNSNWQWWERK